MTATSIPSPFEFFTGSNGTALNNGYIYIGTANLNPETNPITVYWDEALSIPAAQPIRTINGWPSRNGSAARIYTNIGDYSITVRNSSGVLVYSTNVTSQQLFISVSDFGAIGNGSTSDVAAFQAAINSVTNGDSATIIVPAGAYAGDFSTLTYGTRNIVFSEAGSVSYTGTAPTTTRLGTDSQYGSLLGYWINGSLLMKSRPTSTNTSVLRVRSDTTDAPSIANTAYVERLINHDSGLSNPHALRVNTQVNVDTVSNEWAVSGDVQTSSNGVGNVVSVSGVTTRQAAGVNNTAFGGHFQSKDDVAYGAPTDVSPAVGIEVNIAGKGLDHPTANLNHGRRLVLHVLAHGVTAYGAAGNNAEIGRGIAIGTEGQANGAFFRTGLHIYESLANANKIDTAIRVDTTGAYGLRLVGAHTTADISLDGNSSYGILCLGTYTNAAIRIGDNDYIGLRDNNAIKFRYDTATGTVDWYNGVNDRFSFSLGATPNLALNSTQVLTTRRTGYTNAMTGVANRATAYDTAAITLPQLAERVKALQDDLTTHGLIGV